MHLKAHNTLCKKGNICSHNISLQLLLTKITSLNFLKFFILGICWDTPTKKNDPWQLLTVSGAFKTKNCLEGIGQFVHVSDLCLCVAILISLRYN